MFKESDVKKLVLFLVAVSSVFSFTSNSYANEISVGIIANRGAIAVMKRWGELGKYLAKETGSHVRIVPLKPNKITAAAEKGSVDYILTNPVLTLIIKEKYGATPLVTLNRNSGSQFAGVIFSKKGSGITKATDLKGKKVMSYKFKKSAAAYVFQVKHVMDQNVKPHEDFAKFIEAKKQDDIVYAVRSGMMDGGFIKSGLLEAMSKEGKIKLDEFEIVDQQKDELSQVHSTALYPEWYFTATKAAKGEINKKVSAALLKLKPNHIAAKKGKIKGFVKPLSLDSMAATLKALKLPPYES